MVYHGCMSAPNQMLVVSIPLMFAVNNAEPTGREEKRQNLQSKRGQLRMVWGYELPHCGKPLDSDEKE